MKKFVFRFDAVERVRKIRQDDALKTLAQAQRALQAELDRRASILKSIADGSARRADLASNSAPVSVLQVEDLFIVGARQSLTRADAAILRARKQVEKAMRIYIVARRHLRSIEILKDREKQLHREKVAKAADKEADDLVVMRTRLNEQGDES